MPDDEPQVVYLRGLRESLRVAVENGHDELAARIRRTIAEAEGGALTGDAEPRATLRDEAGS